MSLWTLLILPAAVAVLGAAAGAWRWLPRACAVLMTAQLGVAAAVCLPAIVHPGSAGAALDGVSAWFTILTTLVAAAAFVQGASLLPAEDDATPRRIGLFYVLSGLFLLAMYGVLLARNLGYLWIAMEATTLMSAPLVYYHRSRNALEATWKYLMLCSVGIAFALFGTILLVAAQHGAGEATLAYDGLLARARSLDPHLLRLGYVFCLLGYGTKAGLFPLHNWLPDAHSEAPAPASAMLSGALLNCALVAVWRVSQIVTAAGQGDLVRDLLVPAGAVTVLAASLMLVRQHDLKRMWAYSSVEHVGLLTLAIGVGSTPVFLLHALNHSLVKVALFLLAGSITHVYGTKSLAKLGGLLKTAPAWGVLLAAGTFAIGGSPPFGTFISEWLLLRDTLACGERLAAGVVIVALTITFIALASQLDRVVFGKPRASVGAVRAATVRAWSATPAILLALALVTGGIVSPPVMAALSALGRGGLRLP